MRNPIIPLALTLSDLEESKLLPLGFWLEFRKGAKFGHITMLR